MRCAASRARFPSSAMTQSKPDPVVRRSTWGVRPLVLGKSRGWLGAVVGTCATDSIVNGAGSSREVERRRDGPWIDRKERTGKPLFRSASKARFLHFRTCLLLRPRQLSSRDARSMKRAARIGGNWPAKAPQDAEYLLVLCAEPSGTQRPIGFFAHEKRDSPTQWGSIPAPVYWAVPFIEPTDKHPQNMVCASS